MKKYWRYLKSIRKELLFLFFLALGTLILIDFWLIEIPEKFNGGAKIGRIAYRLSISYISAFIFYFLVVHLKNQKDKENIYSYISGKVYTIINTAKDLVNSLSKESNVAIENVYPTESELTKICSLINPNSKAPLILGRLSNYANWIQFFNYYRERSNDATQKIYLKMNFLDSDLVSHLARIEDCSHFGTIKLMNNLPIRNKNLSEFEPELLKYFNLVKDLEKYYNKNLISYN